MSFVGRMPMAMSGVTGGRIGLSLAAPVGSLSALSSQRRGYSEAVIDHFNKPHNVGKLDGKKANVGTAIVGKASCGDVIKLQIQVGKDGVIEDAKFKTFGCGSAIAASSLATQKLIGSTISDADQIKNTDLSRELKLPPVKVHCSVLAEEAIQEAIKDFHAKSGGEKASA